MTSILSILRNLGLGTWDHENYTMVWTTRKVGKELVGSGTTARSGKGGESGRSEPRCDPEGSSQPETGVTQRQGTKAARRRTTTSGDWIWRKLDDDEREAAGRAHLGGNGRTSDDVRQLVGGRSLSQRRPRSRRSRGHRECSIELKSTDFRVQSPFSL